MACCKPRLPSLVLLLLALLAGCGRMQPPATAPLDTWDVFFMQGARIGHGHVRQHNADYRGQPAVKTTAETVLAVRRFGDETLVRAECISWERPDGALLAFECTTHMGPTPQTTRGTVDGGKLRIETDALPGGAARPPLTVSISDRLGGFNALENDLARRPIKPGETRTIESLWPIVNQPATTTLTARSAETTSLLDGSRSLLRIDAATQLGDAPPLESTLWVSDRGEVLKNRVEALDQTVYRTTRDVALGKAAATNEPTGDGLPPSFDLGWSSLVKLSAAPGDLHQAREAKYRVEVTGGDPAKIFPSDAAQHVRAIGPNTAEIAVIAIRADRPPTVELADDQRPTDADSRPSAMIQSDDPRVAALAAEAAGDETDPWPTAVALERFVNRKIRAKNFSQAFASAAEVAATLEGDCSEHAVLLAAMARARGLPARVVMGLVYVEPQNAFGFHLWTTVFVGDRWIPLDATLGLGGIGCGHLQLADTNLSEGNALAEFLRVAQVLGRLKIDVLEVDGVQSPPIGAPHSATDPGIKNTNGTSAAPDTGNEKRQSK
ncbi:MAG TPA: transglutaminase family protein [Pirellulales bacterium]|nr:transglutaminase family protein [Pirellulales bacterium]